LSDHRRHRLQEILDFARRTTTDDFIGSKPDLVIVDDRGERWVPGGMSFDYVGFFQQDPRFRDEWARYEKIARVRGLEIWRRNGEGSRGAADVSASVP
jgi:hypothetical protein